jgi:hypothetical protein
MIQVKKKKKKIKIKIKKKTKNKVTDKLSSTITSRGSGGALEKIKGRE